MHLQIATRHVADAVIAMPVGRIDHRSAADFEAGLTPLVTAAVAAKGALVLDFSGIEYISSVGLRVLMIAAKKMRERERRSSSRRCRAWWRRSSPSAASTASSP